MRELDAAVQWLPCGLVQQLVVLCAHASTAAVRRRLGGEPLGLLLQNGELDALALGKADHGLVALANDEHVGLAGGKAVACDTR